MEIMTIYSLHLPISSVPKTTLKVQTGSCGWILWYHKILVVNLQDSVGAFGAKWQTKQLHRALTLPHRGVLP